jgi:signal transduction histidine kinase
MQFMTFIHPDDVGMISEGFHTLLLRRDANVFSEFRVITKSGDTKWLSVHGTYIEWNGRPAGMVYIEDVSERKQQEHQIQSYQQQLQALASQLTLTEERERRRLAVELHDHIGQALALARIQIAAAQSSQLEATRNALLAETSEILKEAIQETRTLVFDLSSPVLNELGLSAAISEWLQKYAGKQAGLKSELVEIGPDFPMSVDLRAILYRSVRELLTNVIRHAQASYVRVTLEQSRSQACITVQDDGIGFQADDISARLSHSSGFGLFSIQEQINDLGGNLTIQTTPGEGTKITVCVPHHDL